MAAIEKKPIKITETVLRDAHQSLIATRLTTEQMLPIVDKMDKVGYHCMHQKEVGRICFRSYFLRNTGCHRYGRYSD